MGHTEQESRQKVPILNDQAKMAPILNGNLSINSIHLKLKKRPITFTFMFTRPVVPSRPLVLPNPSPTTVVTPVLKYFKDRQQERTAVLSRSYSKARCAFVLYALYVYYI